MRQISSGSRRIVGTATLLVAQFCQCAFAEEYACLRQAISFRDIFVRRNELASSSYSGVGGLNPEFPRTKQEAEVINSDIEPWSLIPQDCSNEGFLCLEVTQGVGNTGFKYKLVVPRMLEDDREYEFGDVHVVTRIAPALAGSARSQVTIWQEINGQVRPIELTLEKGRGVTYWDGFRDLPDAKGPGALCALRAGLGFFSNVEFAEK